jgi:predicted nucleic acid-binding Zn ribbon protein
VRINLNAKPVPEKDEPFVAVGDILAGVMRSMGLEKRLLERRVIENWPELAGPDIARFAKAMRVQRGILYLKVESAAWSQELLFLKPKILERVNERFGSGLVRDIRITGR